MTKAQQAVLDALKANPGAWIGYSSWGDDGRCKIFGIDKPITVRSGTMDALIKANAIKNRGSIWAREWVAA